MVERGHVYLVRNIDVDTRQVAAFLVERHSLNTAIQLWWVRSPDSERFVPPASCELEVQD